MKKPVIIFLIAASVVVIAVLTLMPSAGAKAADDLLVLFQTNDRTLIEDHLRNRYQATDTQAKRVCAWVQAHQPIRSVVFKRQGDGQSLMPDSASHYLRIIGQYGIGHLSVNVVTAQPPRSVLQMMHDDMGNAPIRAPGIYVGP